MTLEEEFYIRGYLINKFKNTESVDYLNEIITQISSQNLKPNFTFEKKYKNTLDLRPNTYLYDDIFIDILFDNKIPELIQAAVGTHLELAHIQLRLTTPGHRFGSYTGWHRDTHFYSGKGIVGNIPPTYKLIYYPSLKNIDTPQMKLIEKSHHFVLNSKLLDKLLPNLCKAIVINSSNERFLFFNTLLQHNAIRPSLESGSFRLIYSFVRNDQLASYGNEKLSELYKNRVQFL
jgi:hypothetical protein